MITQDGLGSQLFPPIMNPHSYLEIQGKRVYWKSKRMKNKQTEFQLIGHLLQ